MTDKIHLAAFASIGRERARDFRIALAEGLGPGARHRKLVGARDSELRLRLENARGGDSHVVVLLQRRANQLLQHRVLENLPPLFVAQRFRRSDGGLGRAFAAIGAGRINRRPLVFRSNGAAGEQKPHRQERELSHFNRPPAARPQATPPRCAACLPKASRRNRKSLE